MKQKHVKVTLVIVFLIVLSLSLGAGTWDFILPLSKTTAICQDDSVYWIGTEKGLIKLDTSTGETVQFHDLNSPLSSSSITGIVRGWDGRIWVGTKAGLAVYNGSRMKLCDQNMLKTNYANHPVSSLITDDEGQVWTCFSESSFGGAEYHTVVKIMGLGGLVSNEYFTDYDYIGYSSKGICAAYREVVKTEYGEDFTCNDNLKLWDGKLAKTHKLKLGLYHNQYAIDKNGDVLILAESDDREDNVTNKSLHILRNFSVDSNSPIILPLDYPGKVISMISGDPFNNVFAVIDDKAFIWNGSVWTNLNLPAEFIKSGISLTGTADGKIAAVNQSQLLEIDDTATRTYTINPALIGHEHNLYSEDMVRDSTGKIWFATGGSLVSFDGSTWKQIIYGTPSDPEGERQVALELDSSDKIWLGYDENLYTVEGDRLVLQRAVPGLIDLGVDNEDRLWVMCRNQLLCHQSGTWKQFINSNCGLQNMDIIDFYVDSRNRLWAHSGYSNNPAHEYQIYSFNGVKWLSYSYDIEAHLQGGGVSDLYVDNKDRLWVGGSNMFGVICYQIGKVTEYPADVCSCGGFMEAHDGTMWTLGITLGNEIDYILHLAGKSLTTYPSIDTFSGERHVYIDKSGNTWFGAGTVIYNEKGVDLWGK